MARRASAKTVEPEPEVEETAEAEEGGGFRSQMWKHEAMVEWLAEQTGEDLEQMSAAEIIALAFARRVAWRKSQEYLDLVEEYRSSRPAKATKAATNGAEDEEEEEETPAPRKRGRPAKAAPQKVSAQAAPVKAVRKAAKRTGENPFD